MKYKFTKKQRFIISLIILIILLACTRTKSPDAGAPGTVPVSGIESEDSIDKEIR